MDNTDIALLVLMQQDGRASFTSLAKAVGISENAVRQRVQRLLREELMQIVAVTDPANVGLRRRAMVGISVDGGDPHEVAGRLSALPNVHYVARCAGRYDVLAELVCRDDEHLREVLSEDVRSIPGVSRTELFVYLTQAKHNFAWGKLTA
ncbi:Lrp/AsnC family transcriptional regulator [Amycolatopsis sp. NPDC024027]|uniref:Lrp/AsnC family transcriptional regulator n=1 Tax=Amycolatopsis sp. NPDC024027 TaxID=3154327 RepID=UPI0033D05ACC